MKKGWGFGPRLLTAAGLSLALASPALAAPAHDADRGTDLAPVKAELLADTAAVVPGKPFKLGVLFRVLPEFHIYWKNPGDAGLPTSVTFELPAGFAVGDLQWPLPRQFVQPGDIVGYGYEGTVMLMAEVTPPQNLEIGRDIAVRAKVSWLSCRTICIPGKAESSVQLPVANQSEPFNAALFAEWAARIPRPAPFLPEIGGPVRLALIPQVRIAVTWKTEPEKVELFPVLPEDVLLDKVTINTREKQTVITFAPRRTGVAGPAEVLDCVVAYTLPDGARKGFPARIPLPALIAPPPAK